jgi:hypothetical protein
MENEKTLQELFVEVLDRKIPAKDLGRRKWVSTREALLRNLIEKAESGDVRAIKLLTDLYPGSLGSGVSYGRR